MWNQIYLIYLWKKCSAKERCSGSFHIFRASGEHFREPSTLGVKYLRNLRFGYIYHGFNNVLIHTRLKRLKELTTNAVRKLPVWVFRASIFLGSNIWHRVHIRFTLCHRSFRFQGSRLLRQGIGGHNTCRSCCVCWGCGCWRCWGGRCNDLLWRACHFHPRNWITRIWVMLPIRIPSTKVSSRLCYMWGPCNVRFRCQGVGLVGQPAS